MFRSLMLVAGVVSAITLATGASAQGSVDRGQALIQRNCAMCHAIGPTGTSPHNGAPPFRTLSQRYPLEMLEEALAEGMLTGHPAMPEFRFAPRQIDDIIAYLRSVQSAKNVLFNPSLPATGNVAADFKDGN